MNYDVVGAHEEAS